MTGTAITQIDDPQAFPTGYTLPNGINDRGDVVGDYFNYSGNHGFLYANGVYTTLDDPLAFPGDTYATGINNLGQIVDGFVAQDGSGAHGFLYQGGTFTTIVDPLGPDRTYLTGINDAGDIVGYYWLPNGANRGFVYTAGTFVPVNDPLAVFGTQPRAINNLGQIAGFGIASQSPVPEVSTGVATLGAVLALFGYAAARGKCRN